MKHLLAIFIYANKTKNIVKFKIKLKYYLELFASEDLKLLRRKEKKIEKDKMVKL